MWYVAVEEIKAADSGRRFAIASYGDRRMKSFLVVIARLCRGYRDDQLLSVAFPKADPKELPDIRIIEGKKER